MRSVLVRLVVLICCLFAAIDALAAPKAHSDAGTCLPDDPRAELFVTDDTDPLFEMQAAVTVALTGAAVTGSTPLDGVYWSTALQQSTSEHSREFHVCGADMPTLHAAAEALRRRFDQESVLAFDYLPAPAPTANAVLIAVPNIDVEHFGAALLTDSTARTRLRGGSVTTTDHTLILVAGNDDREQARRLVGEAGGDWHAASITYGRSEFVE